MKIKLSIILPVITALFVGLTLGLFLGRNPAGGSVTVSVPARLASAAVPAETQTEPSAQAASLPVNINTADAAELAALPGIGKVLAQRILDYRRVHGDFSAVEQLTNVEGIGEGKLESILELITIGG